MLKTSFETMWDKNIEIRKRTCPKADTSLFSAPETKNALCILRFKFLAPVPHGVKNGLQAPAKFCQGVFHPRGNFRVDLAVYKTIAFHIAKLCGQNFLRNRSDGFLQFAEAFCTREQIPEDQYFPFISDQHIGDSERTKWQKKIKPKCRKGGIKKPAIVRRI